MQICTLTFSYFNEFILKKLIMLFGNFFTILSQKADVACQRYFTNNELVEDFNENFGN